MDREPAVTTELSLADAVSLPSGPPGGEAACDGSMEDIESNPRLLEGRVLGERYRLVKLLGQGAMGCVYLGEQLTLKKDFAIKILNPSLTRDAKFKARFHQEAKIAASVRHPGIAEVFDYGVDNGVAYYVMELLEGKALNDYLRDKKQLCVEEAARIVCAVADAVAAAHDNGVVHRDLKPANIFLARDGAGREVIKVLDFGVSKATSTRLTVSSQTTAAGFVCGTPSYMSPEQAGGRPVDGRSDLYSLAVVLYRLIAGRPPFEASDSVVVMSMHIESKAPRICEKNPEVVVPPAVEEVLGRALAKRPEDRYQSMREFAAALSAAVSDGRNGAKASPRPVSYAPSRPTPPEVRSAPPPPPPPFEEKRTPTRPKAAPGSALQRKVLIGASAGVAAIVLIAVALLMAGGTSPAPATQAFSPPPAVLDVPLDPAPVVAVEPVKAQDEAPPPDPRLDQVALEAEPMAPSRYGSTKPAVPAPSPKPTPTKPAVPRAERRVPATTPALGQAKVVLTSKRLGVRASVGGANHELRLNAPKLIEVAAGSVKIGLSDSSFSCAVVVDVPKGEQRAVVLAADGTVVALGPDGRKALSCQR